LHFTLTRQIKLSCLPRAKHATELLHGFQLDARGKIKPAASFHVLRHTHGSTLATRGVPMGVIAAAPRQGMPGQISMAVNPWGRWRPCRFWAR
jgi:hypothetical protein